MTSGDSSEEHLDFSAPVSGDAAGPGCAACGKPVGDQYWSVGSAVICAACRTRIALEEGEAARLDARGRRFAQALLFGIGGMIAGAAVWYGVAKFLDLEIGLIAILLGWLVGKGVMKGSGERGGRRYQVMAVLLTYLGIGLGYLPFVIEAQMEKSAAAATVSGDSSAALRATDPPDRTTEQVATPSTPDADEERVGFLQGIGALLVLIATLPVYVVTGSFPGSLISILIYGFAILQAWRITASRELAITGPFKVGTVGTA